jgi:hypothetical protein
MADQFKARTLKRKNVKGLALNAAPKSTPTLSNGDSQVPGAAGNGESNRTDTLEIGLEFRLDLRSEDLITLKELGAGNGGTVSKVMHASTKVVMARKVGFTYMAWVLGSVDNAARLLGSTQKKTSENRFCGSFRWVTIATLQI